LMHNRRSSAAGYTDMMQGMQESYEKGVANHSAPSFALDTEMEADNHSDISSTRADGSSAMGCSIALSMENGSLNAAANRRA